MDFFFVSFDSPFYWVRAASLESAIAHSLDVQSYPMFKKTRLPPGAAVVFNRFCFSHFYRWISRKCAACRVPYAFDVDDIFWDLPRFSSDDAVSASCVRDIESILDRAALLTVSTEVLAERLRERYPGKRMVIVPNCTLPAEFPPGGVCIANTDSFKLGPENTLWFRELLRDLVRAGVPVQLYGENHNLISGLDDFDLGTVPRLDYSDYLQAIRLSGARFGLIPVETGVYADCKSEIKILEMCGAGMTVYASPIAPYWSVAERSPGLPLRLVPNTKEDWSKAVQEIIAKIPAEDRAANKTVMTLLANQRRAQFEAWREVHRVLSAQMPENASSAFRKLQGAIEWRQRLQKVARKVRLVAAV